MLPWTLYNLTPRDISGAQIRPYFFTQTDNFAGVIGNTIDVPLIPSDNVLLLSNFQASLADTGQNPISITCTLKETAPSIVVHQSMTFWADTAQKNALGISWHITGSPLFVIPPAHQFSFQGTLGAVAINATMKVNLAGILIPKGTIALS